MDIKVALRMVDEFNQVSVGESESVNLDHEAHGQLDTLFRHIKQAVLALGFTPEQVDEYMK